MEPSPLPDFESPPVREVIAGVQFVPLPGMSAAHVGAFWSRIREQYPETMDVPPLPPVLEQPPDTMDIQVSNVPPLPRVLFGDAAGNHLVQLQVDRLHLNWRKVRETDSYPRFPEVRKLFLETWNRFCAFACDHSLGSISVRQYELTYVNQMLRGASWEDLGQIHRMLPFLQIQDGLSGRCFLPMPDRAGWALRFPCSPCRGNLHVVGKHGLAGEVKQEMVTVEVTVRGSPSVPAGEDLEQWMDSAHEWIVRGFVDVTGPEAHKVWGRRR